MENSFLVFFTSLSIDFFGQNFSTPINVATGTYPQGVFSSLNNQVSTGIKLISYNNAWEIFNHGSNHGFCVYDRTAQAYRMFINTTGNVGIGTLNPTAPLTVNGKILAEEFEIVTDVPASDFVFNKGYKLRSLNEVEKFVQVNKHLPEIPSAKEFKENGYKVGQMDDLLLRKVEELTLYTIELNKQVEALKAELAKVKGGE